MKRVAAVLTVVVVLALSVFLTAVQASGAAAEPDGPFIRLASGDVGVKLAAGKDWKPAGAGAPLAGGDSVRTGNDGRAEIGHPNGAIRLFPNSQLLVPGEEKGSGQRVARKVAMEQGSGVFRVSAGSVKGGFEVKTLQVIAGVKGTMFSVHASQRKTRVAVYRGVVEVTDLKRTPSTSTLLYRGQFIEVEDGKGFGLKRGFYPGDPWGDWQTERAEPALNDRSDFQGSQGVSSGYRGGPYD